MDYDKSLVAEALAQFAELRQYVDRGVVPPKPNDLEPWRCEYCDYSETCGKVEGATTILENGKVAAGPTPKPNKAVVSTCSTPVARTSVKRGAG